MNMQQANGDILFAAKNRIAVLQQTVKDGQLSIESRNAENDRRREASLRENMKPSEFLALFPNPPTFAAEDSEIAAKQAEIDALNAGTGTNHWPQANLQTDINMFYTQKIRKTADYNRNLIKPERPLTADEFETLYTAPSHTADQAAISAGQTEANALHAFLKSGPYPLAGLYDADLLADTQITYP